MGSVPEINICHIISKHKTSSYNHNVTLLVFLNFILNPYSMKLFVVFIWTSSQLLSLVFITYMMSFVTSNLQGNKLTLGGMSKWSDYFIHTLLTLQTINGWKQFSMSSHPHSRSNIPELYSERSALTSPLDVLSHVASLLTSNPLSTDVSASLSTANDGNKSTCKYIN